MRRGEVWLVDLDPAVGSELQKKKPCVIVSPDTANARLRTVVIAPLTSTVRNWPTRVRTRFAGKPGEAALDQIRAVDKRRLMEHLGVLADGEIRQVGDALMAMFSRRPNEQR